MKIYTRTGDSGRTGLFGGGRVPKDHLRVEAYGSVDELNAVIGRSIVDVADPQVGERLRTIQQDLFSIGAVLARPPATEGRRSPAAPGVPVERVAEMEGWIDSAAGELEPLRNFIVPGGTSGAAGLHHARTVCRRAERRVVSLTDRMEVEDGILRYLNRLSDLLFTFARLENARAGRRDVVWRSPGER
ncbi:MAG: cob(I)yrinic acid a,c-diamide adenosyltransferase [Gemmatimonadetes bacterium]|nr:cob(I)yrinic acid a,c-diamide adenosyltransferase [Gemmatimonadota bacterium]NIR81570.1 cob(I)yrinic acid a,c-diamide adenosyltransferase [Gemmatimonadota bacterium]NIT90411.1 cob(I)yrinic acid a,c-diamide adenosyltransferase [Gemmatimonadota bacterium]NIU34245.1 cob(I)yrinic acid a,c-diamide adenosyltransferase [Gemmatimonadota bacterium]NIU38373.1 cob(I)yrinic acid a,c-diamide adenosyltransferase [Gemmatimonadota bacterium]